MEDRLINPANSSFPGNYPNSGVAHSPVRKYRLKTLGSQFRSALLRVFEATLTIEFSLKMTYDFNSLIRKGCFFFYATVTLDYLNTLDSKTAD